jgi:hypothetical protein
MNTKLSSKVPLVVYAKNPDRTPQEKQYPPTGITIDLTAIKESA